MQRRQRLAGMASSRRQGGRLLVLQRWGRWRLSVRGRARGRRKRDAADRDDRYSRWANCESVSPGPRGGMDASEPQGLCSCGARPDAPAAPGPSARAGRCQRGQGRREERGLARGRRPLDIHCPARRIAPSRAAGRRRHRPCARPAPLYSPRRRQRHADPNYGGQPTSRRRRPRLDDCMHGRPTSRPPPAALQHAALACAANWPRHPHWPGR